MLLFVIATVSPGVTVLVMLATGRASAEQLGVGTALAVGWFVVVASLIGVGVARGFIEASRESRRRAGHCTLCGYDLTGNVSGVCPECGTIAST